MGRVKETMMTTDWRIHDTPEARSAFGDAQYRLDNLNYGEDGYTPEQAAADEKLTDRFDRLVLQPAHDEFERQCDADEFARHFPEPADGARVEFEYDGGARYAAYRMDVPEQDGGTWWMYGPDERPRTWRRLVVEFEIRMDDLMLLALVEG